ncbi:MAG: hypothetical protein JWM41_4147 [Gemmatimonadetes bacterium]|nr:hypothetical protein [Gemmatimonadota bacterium]
MNGRHMKAVTAGFLGGLLLGATVWSTQMHRSRRELFSKRPVRRLAALGYLSGRPGLDTVRILTDYVGWERHPALRRRGERVLRRMHTHLD